MQELTRQDAEHLRLLVVFHYVVAGIAALFALLPILHLLIGIGMLGGFFDQHGTHPPPRFLGWFFVIFPLAIMLFAASYAIALLFAARFLRERRRYRFCFVVAGISCLFSPFGTVLGIFTILMLVQERVRAAFGLEGAS